MNKQKHQIVKGVEASGTKKEGSLRIIVMWDDERKDAYFGHVPGENRSILYIGQDVFKDQEHLFSILTDVVCELEAHRVDPLSVIEAALDERRVTGNVV